MTKRPAPKPHPIVDELMRSMTVGANGSHGLPVTAIEKALSRAREITAPQLVYLLLQDWFALVAALGGKLDGAAAAEALATAAVQVADHLVSLSASADEQSRARAQAARDTAERQKKSLASRTPGIEPPRTGGAGVALRKR